VTTVAGTSTDLSTGLFKRRALCFSPCVRSSVDLRFRDGPRCRRPRYPDPILLADFPQHCGGACSCRTRVHHCRDWRHVDAQTCRSPSGCRRRLLLESRGGLRDYGCPIHPSVAGEYAPLRARYSVIRRWNDRTDGKTAALARLAPTAHRLHGDLIHPAAHGVLRGQRTTPAAMAFAATSSALAPTELRRRSSSDLGVETSSAHSEPPRASPTLRVKRIRELRLVIIASYDMRVAVEPRCCRYHRG
jgi:hypothetical protein